MSEKVRILLVDDDQLILETIFFLFRKEERFEFTFSESAEFALERIQNETFDLVITDLKMPGMDGFELMDRIREKGHDLPVILLSSFKDVPLVVSAMKRGALNYITKPIEKELLIHSIERAMDQIRLKREVDYLKDQLRFSPAGTEIIGQSRAIMKIFDQIENLSDTSSTVLIRGETGTGKELVARAIHRNSERKDRPLIKINCAALPEELLESELFGHEKGAFTGAVRKKPGKFEVADGGTVFLDEIGDISPRLQAKLLRFLQEKEFERVGGIESIKVDVRIISATNSDLEEAMENERFRKDLYYRLNVFPITIPPLRERKDDIPLLAMHFLQLYSQKFNRPVETMSREVLDRFLLHKWPGNVRELENQMERAVIVCRGSVINVGDTKIPAENGTTAEHHPSADMKPGLSYREGKNLVIQRFEKKFIESTLMETGGSISKTAERMEISPRSLYEKMKNYGISKEKYKKRGSPLE